MMLDEEIAMQGYLGPKAKNSNLKPLPPPTLELLKRKEMIEQAERELKVHNDALALLTEE
jgi:hypothetical protein